MVQDDEAYCQPCVSPVWDTGLVCHALLEAGGERAVAEATRGLDWLVPMQVLDVGGDWIARRPDVRPGGWAFQYANPHYPDLDDTAVVAMAMDRVQNAVWAQQQYADSLGAGQGMDPRAAEPRTAAGARSTPTTSYYYLNNIPFADHGALLDPPTEDVSARCLSMLAQFGEQRESPAVTRAIDYLRKTQLADGSWYGRWGMNYIYGTWSVLCALNAAGFAREAPEMRKAAIWLAAIQNADGGWGEDGASYKLDYKGYEKAPSTRVADRLGAARPDGGGRSRSSGGGARHRLSRRASRRRRLLGRGALHRRAVFRACFICATTAIAKFFPLWALARYRNLKRGNTRAVAWGM